MKRAFMQSEQYLKSNNIIEFPSNKKTRRMALRYQLRPRIISFTHGGETGEATLLNISTTGLLVELATVPVNVGDEVVIILDCFHSAQETPLELRARVVRVNFDEFAGTFIDLDRQQARDLIHRLTREARQSLSPSYFELRN